jgi:hypothetical protein
MNDFFQEMVNQKLDTRERRIHNKNMEKMKKHRREYIDDEEYSR